MAKEVRIDGSASDWYKEAIFILKEGVDESRTPVNLVTYADELLERQMKLGIIQKYQGSVPAVAKKDATIRQREGNNRARSVDTTWIDTFLWFTIGLFVLTCVIYFAL